MTIALVPASAAAGSKAASTPPLGGDIVYSATEVEPDSGESTGGLSIDRGGSPSGPGIPLTTDPTETEPTYSPDGELIAFAYDSDVLGWTGPYGIATMHADGSGLTRLTEERHDSSPAFSPDGSLVAFDRGGSIYVIGVDGTGLRQVTEDHGRKDRQPAFTPDGGHIVFTRTYVSKKTGHQTSGLYSVAVGGGQISAFLDGRSAEANPTFSPNGKLLAYNDEQFLVLADADGSHRRRLLGHERTSAEGPAFSSDSRHLACLTVTIGHPGIEEGIVVTSLGSNPRVLGTIARAGSELEGGTSLGAPTWGRQAVRPRRAVGTSPGAPPLLGTRPRSLRQVSG
jgi:dipeptidyl aminopeptidase/acylaminoacyl peptidase